LEAGRWQAKVWSRYHHADLAALAGRSAAYVAAVRTRAAPRLDHAPPRRPFPADWALHLQEPPCGRILYLRRTTDAGSISLLGHTFALGDAWPNRLVRADVDLDTDTIAVSSLRRRTPEDQPLLARISYHLPHRPFRE
jgi:hypothetical protein